MSSNFYSALDRIKDLSKNSVEQGKAFEKLCKIFFENDDIQKQEFHKIWHYKDWAKENSKFSKTDIGIDLIGELKDNKGLAAIQCKFFKSDHQISKEDLDSFVSASSNEIFTRLILIDTSSEDLGANAKSMIDNLNKTYQRIQKYDLENSRIDWLDSNTEKINSLLPPLNEFILPGGSEFTARIHIARSECRDAERVIIALSENEFVPDSHKKYINRLSDFFFVLARIENFQKGKSFESLETTYSWSRSGHNVDNSIA